jgi:transposase
MRWTLGIDLACRAAHVASLAGPEGTLVWSGRTFFTQAQDLEQLWRDLDCDPADLTVVMEPTRNAWTPVASWFKRRGVKVVLVPTTQSADLRAYYSKHTKNDRLDSALLARLPLLHPEGLREHNGDGPADPLRRVVKQRSSVMKRRAAVFARIDALLELLGPGWYQELGTDYGNASLHLLARYANPHDLVRLGPSRLARFLIRYSHGQWRQAKATALIQVARDSLALWGQDGMDFAALAADVAVEADQALMFTAQVRALDVRIAALYREADPDQIVRTAPGVGPVLAAAIIGRLGDPHRFTSLSAIRSYSGLVPKVRQSGQAEHDGGITKAGDPMLREATWIAADMARRADPQLAAKYVRLMNTGRHHDSAICHVATALLTRIASCLRAGQPYIIRDLDGTPITEAQGRHIVTTHHQVDPAIRAKNAGTRKTQRLKHRTSRVSQKSQSAPTSRPATHQPTSRQVA